MRRSLLLIVVSLGVWAAAPEAVQSDGVPLNVLLQRASSYIANFVTKFSNVVCEENYVQESTAPLPTMVVSGLTRGGGISTSGARPGSARRRELKSDFLVVKLPGDLWQPFRDVFEVDGVAIRDRQERLSKLFLSPTPDAQTRARQIAEDSSRYNLGNLQRTINNPVFGLIFLLSEHQARSRFAFTTSGGPVPNGVRVVVFTEEATPTLILGRSGQAMPAHGRFWIEGGTGRIVKSEILVTRADISLSVTTLFEVDQRLQVSVPVEMREVYDFNGGHIKATAKYSRFRQFAVSASEEIMPPEPQ